MPIRPLSSELQKKVVSELKEVPSRIHEDLKHIREWLSKQPHLNARTDDQWLVSFLRSCKFSLQRTKEKLDLFYTMRKLASEFFENRDPLLPDIQEVLKRRVIIVLSKPENSTDPRIALVRADLADPESVPLATIAKVALMMFEILLIEDDNLPICGQCCLFNFEGANYKYLAQLTPSIIKKGLLTVQNAYPTRIKGIYVYKVPSFLEAAVKTVKALLTEKIKRRLHFFNNGNLKEFNKIIPLSILPQEYGGEGGTWNEIGDEWKRKIESYRDWFLEDAQYCADESKRPGKPKTSGEMFGLEGSFRKLDID